MTQAKLQTNNFSQALKFARKARRLSQEDFGLVSSRTYVSSLERGLYSPTLDKLDELSGVLGIHPLTLIAMAYLKDVGADFDSDLLTQISVELADIRNVTASM